MAAFYRRRSNFALAAALGRTLTSNILFQQRIKPPNPNNPLFSLPPAAPLGFQPKQNHQYPYPSPWTISKRCYFGGFFVQHPVLALTLCTIPPILLWNFKTIPYTYRRHFVLLPNSAEIVLGELAYFMWMASTGGAKLPAQHPHSLRASSIFQDILSSTIREVRKQKTWTGFRCDTGHLERIEWEVVIMNNPDIHAGCFPCGTIILSTGLLEHYKTDDEFATVISHEVAHIVARHGAEHITRRMLIVPIQVMPPIAKKMLRHMRTTFAQRKELEADYIGMLLMASAGYNPQAAPLLYLTLDRLESKEYSEDQIWLRSHPSGEERAKFLSEAKVMQEAVDIYRESMAGRR